MRKLLATCLIMLLTIAVASATAAYVAYEKFVVAPVDSASQERRIFDTAQSTTVLQIARRLENEGYIHSAWSIRILARYQKKDTAIKAGEYELSPAMTPQQILDKMVRGEMVHHRTTIKEGMTLREIVAAFEDSGVVSREDFERALKNNALLDEFQIEARSFEGYLFPETYHFPRNTSARVVIKAMIDELNKKWKPEWEQQLTVLSMSKHNLLTLASIIEKESGNFDEQPIISSVFHNRLRYKMRLQADPTVIYGISDFNGNITKRDLETYSAYNTYVIDGLPPGPIANPGRTAIHAALYPAETSFLYFVGSGDGRHVFSKSLAEHNKAVNKYQRRRRTPKDK